MFRTKLHLPPDKFPWLTPKEILRCGRRWTRSVRTNPAWTYLRWLAGTPSSRQSSEPRPRRGLRSTTTKRSVIPKMVPKVLDVLLRQENCTESTNATKSAHVQEPRSFIQHRESHTFQHLNDNKKGKPNTHSSSNTCATSFLVSFPLLEDPVKTGDSSPPQSIPLCLPLALVQEYLCLDLGRRATTLQETPI